MRKLEEEQYATKLEWVKAHRFPEDTLADWCASQGVKHTRGYPSGHARCVKCNYSTSGLHDHTLINTSGRRWRARRMYKGEIPDTWLCEYCYRPLAQWYEVDWKEKNKDVNDMIEFYEAILKEEGYD